MKILFITARIPYAGVAGGHALVYQRIKRLAKRGHQVGLLSFSRADETTKPDDALFDSLTEFQTIPMPRRAGFIRKSFQSLFSIIPEYFLEYRSAAMMRKAGDMVNDSGYDVVIAEFSAMGQYLHHNPYMPAVRKIISCHFSITGSAQRITRTQGRSIYGFRSSLGLNRLLRYELNMYRGVDRVLVLTAHDRYSMLNADPTLRINVIPVGVDASFFRPDYEHETEEAIVFTGQYEVYSNLDAVQSFVAKCWPILKARRPKLKFYVVGPGAAEALQSIARRDESIIVTGGVNDVRTYMRRAKIFVCPVRLGSGLRFKIFEAMASGLPLVTTTIGAEGIPLQNGDNCFMADKPEIMAECIDLLLSDESLRLSIARQARTLVEERFNWDHGIDLMEEVLSDTFQH